MATYKGTAKGSGVEKSISKSSTRYLWSSGEYVGVRGSRVASSIDYDISRCYFTLNPPASAQIPSDLSKISKITLGYTIGSEYLNKDGVTAIIGVLTGSAGDAQATFELIGNTTQLKSVYVAAKRVVTGSVEVTNTTQIRNIMTYGVGCRASSEATTASQIDSQTPVEIDYTIEFTNETIPPVVTMKNATGETMCQSGYYIYWNYSQFSDSKQNGVECEVDDHGVWRENFKFDSTQDAISGIRGTTMRVANYPKISAPSEDVNVRLRAVSAAGYWSNYATMVLTLKFPMCVPESPSGGENKLGGEDIVLTWSVSAVDGLAIGSYPTKYDVDYSTNGGESWISLAKKATIERVSQKYSYTIPANTLPEGVIKWRVRGYVASSLSGEYTIDSYGEETFVCKIQAGTSTVTCDGKPQPTIGWTSSAQVAYQVRFSDYDSGAVYSAAKTHKIPKIYADGLYPVQVRTQASNGKWSEWTDVKYVQITNSAQSDAVTLTAAVTTHAVALSWVDAGTSAKYIVYRDGMAVYVGTAKTYTDVGANGETKYFVRAVKTTGYYAQSAAVTVDATPQNDCMYDADNAVWIPLRYSLSRRVRNYSRMGQVVYKHYAGRTKPIAYNSGYVTRQMSAEYAFKTRDEALRLNNTVGRVMIYKDTRGGVLIGVVDDVRIAVYARIYSAQLTITEVDYNEEVTI